MRQRSAENKNRTREIMSVEIETPRRRGERAEDTSLRQKYSILIVLTIVLAVVVLLWNTYDYRVYHILQEIEGDHLNTMEADSITPLKTLNHSKLTLDSLTLVSMNVAGCEPSANAPPTWTKDNTTEALQVELLRHNPDVLMLQECPSPEWAKINFADRYSVMGTTESHAGFVALLMRHELAQHAQTIWPLTSDDMSLFVSRADPPAVMAKIHLYQHQSLVVASCHLAYSEEGSMQREIQISDMLLKAETSPSILAGDTNMRETEETYIEKDYQLEDAWKLAGAERATQFSWDTLNHEGEEGGTFNQYYGWTTRKYTKRYDRIYISNNQPRNATLWQKNITVESFAFIANKPVSPNNTRHFLSDHFGIACRLRLW